jgi:hypothetical protein
MRIGRRGFFGAVAAAVAGLAITPALPTPIFTEFVSTAKVGEFDLMIRYMGAFYVSNPRQSAVITGITD